ncbi:cysteine sulfinic acid decarboxylase-like isoform X2 [Artemia franciscana]|uniref:Uncharacterized protein n=2 Tax=Artemia franciscana TaxID=6661 RepID=A0AA88HMS1_ARTSF|nr:hypothetical protein QYM36_009023 [Artemia franciscana]
MASLSREALQQENKFVMETAKLIEKEILSSPPTRKEKVINFLHPQELIDRVDFKLNESGMNQEQLLKLCKDAIKYSVRTSNPMFVNQLYHAADPYSLAGSWLTEALNTNQHTFEAAPFFIVLEQLLLREVRSIIGWESGDGIFAPGGSIGNMYAMTLARHHKYPEAKRKGLAQCGHLVAFTSDEAHYSIKKSANWIGLGMDNVITVKTNEFGEMIPAELDFAMVKAKSEGKIPFFVNATCGTTVLGASDSFVAVGEICKKHDVWMHIDAAWGGSLLLSKKHRKESLKGVELADSIVWNPHKMLGASLQCTLFLTKYQNLLKECNSASATYLFQQDKFYDTQYDTGDKSMQCGRKVDVLKLWLMWKARGTNGLEHLVDNACHQALYFQSLIKERPGFRLVIPRVQCTNVCFWYVPPSLRGQEETEEWWKELGQVAPKIKERMVKEGTMLIGYQPLGTKKLPNFFRLVISCQPPLTNDDMKHIADEIERLGNDL